MLLRNVSNRLVTINSKGEDGKNKPLKILPGENPAVEVSEELCKTAFVKALLKERVLIVEVVDHDEDDEPANDLMSKTKDELLEIAKMIDPDAKGTKAELVAIINGESA